MFFKVCIGVERGSNVPKFANQKNAFHSDTGR